MNPDATSAIIKPALTKGPLQVGASLATLNSGSHLHKYRRIAPPYCNPSCPLTAMVIPNVTKVAVPSPLHPTAPLLHAPDLPRIVVRPRMSIDYRRISRVNNEIPFLAGPFFWVVAYGDEFILLPVFDGRQRFFDGTNATDALAFLTRGSA